MRNDPTSLLELRARSPVCAAELVARMGDEELERYMLTMRSLDVRGGEATPRTLDRLRGLSMGLSIGTRGGSLPCRMPGLLGGDSTGDGEVGKGDIGAEGRVVCSEMDGSEEGLGGGVLSRSVRLAEAISSCGVATHNGGKRVRCTTTA